MSKNIAHPGTLARRPATGGSVWGDLLLGKRSGGHPGRDGCSAAAGTLWGTRPPWKRTTGPETPVAARTAGGGDRLLRQTQKDRPEAGLL